MYCEEPHLIRETTGYASDLQNAENCDCDEKIFKPVCLKHSSNDSFFKSACLAGCSVYDSSTDQYYNCTQMPNTYKQYNLAHNYFTDGLCQTDQCTFRLVISYTCLALLMFLNALTFLPYLKVTIRCIDGEEMNSIGLGIKQFFMTAFGTIPGPILFGSVIDSTCTYWHLDENGQSVCKMYDNKNFALGMGLLGAGFKFLCFLLVLLSLFYIKRNNKRSRT